MVDAVLLDDEPRALRQEVLRRERSAHYLASGRPVVTEDTGFTDRLIFWQTQPPFGTVVDAEQEAKRLRENAAIGKSVSDGTTPTIERRKRAIFEGIF